MSHYDDGYAYYYDTLFTGLDGDTQFYVDEARKSGGPVLELACGTGRVLISMAEAGCEVVGLDLSPKMLAVARRKVSALSDETQSRIELIEGDMRELDLGRKFRLITIPYRAFLAVRTPEEQRSTLLRIREHLEGDGRLVLNFFDPRLDVIVAHCGMLGGTLKKLRETTHPQTGNRVFVWESTRHDPETRTINVDWLFEEIDGKGEVLSRAYSSIALTWIYRQEMQYLLELSGFEIDALYGDFHGGPFHYGGEQIWVASKAGGK